MWPARSGPKEGSRGKKWPNTEPSLGGNSRVEAKGDPSQHPLGLLGMSFSEGRDSVSSIRRQFRVLDQNAPGTQQEEHSMQTQAAPESAGQGGA